MTLGEHIGRCLFVAWRFLYLDAASAKFLDVSGIGFFRSFLAAIPAVGLYALILWIARATYFVPSIETTPIPALITGYLIGWPMFAGLIYVLAKVLERSEYFLSFIVAWHWARVISFLLLLPAAMLTGFGVVGEETGSLLFLVSAAFIGIYRWFVARTCFQVNSMQAILIVALEAIFFRLIESSVVGAFMATVVA